MKPPPPEANRHVLALAGVEMCTEDSVDEPAEGNAPQRIWDEARECSERRALIEQTKGMLMFVYGIGADEAFDVLRKQSQDHNVKLRLVAEQILKDLVELSKAKGPARRLAFDSLMLTAHQRIADVAARLTDGASRIAEKPPQ